MENMPENMPVENGKKNKYLLWGIGLVVLLIAIAVLGKSGVKKLAQTLMPPKQTQVKGPPVTLKVTRTEVPQNQLPQGFPSGIPLEKGAKITQNYNVTAENGLLQATRVFITAKSLNDNFILYSNYLKNNSWAITNSLNLATGKVLSAKKGVDNLQITISQNSITKIKTVDITYTRQK